MWSNEADDKARIAEIEAALARLNADYVTAASKLYSDYLATARPLEREREDLCDNLTPDSDRHGMATTASPKTDPTQRFRVSYDHLALTFKNMEWDYEERAFLDELSLFIIAYPFAGHETKRCLTAIIQDAMTEKDISLPRELVDRTQALVKDLAAAFRTIGVYHTIVPESGMDRPEIR